MKRNSLYTGIFSLSLNTDPLKKKKRKKGKGQRTLQAQRSEPADERDSERRFAMRAVINPRRVEGGHATTAPGYYRKSMAWLQRRSILADFCF